MNIINDGTTIPALVWVTGFCFVYVLHVKSLLKEPDCNEIKAVGIIIYFPLNLVFWPVVLLYLVILHFLNKE